MAEFRQPNEVLGKIHGVYPNGVTADDIKFIFISSTVCHYFPKGFDKVFKNIEAIQVTNSGLRVLGKSDLEPFPKLKAIWFDNNRLISLESDLFQFNPTLKRVYFSSNRIRSIPEDIFDPLDDLNDVFLADNVCVSRDAVGKEQVKQLEADIIKNCQPKKNKAESKDQEIAELRKEIATERRKFQEIKSKVGELFNFY